jgi:hypothetical protein
MVKGQYARGHWSRVHRRNTPPPLPPLLPGPDDDLDVGIIDLDGAGEPVAGPGAGGPPAPDEPTPDEPDEPVKPLGFPPGKSKGSHNGTTRAVPRVTAATRKDIAAKLQLIMFVPGKVWETRDPWCGGMFVHQLPETVDALTDIICDSPDLVAFFTGPAGGFMKYMKLILALQPVGVTAWQHHIAHAIGGPESNGQTQPDMAQYAA